MKLAFLKERGTQLVIRKEIQCAFNFVWKVMSSSLLLNIVFFLPHKSSVSNYSLNALLELCFWLLFQSVTFVATSWSLSSEASISFLLSPGPLADCSLQPGLPSHCSPKLPPPSQGLSSSGCSMATESCQCHESCHFSCTSVTDAVWISKQTPCFPLRKTISFTLYQYQYPHPFAL